MLSLKRTAISFNEEELMELERIIMDKDKDEALRFLEEAIYNKILSSQKMKLKCHLDTLGKDPVKLFKST